MMINILTISFYAVKFVITANKKYWSYTSLGLKEWFVKIYVANAILYAAACGSHEIQVNVMAILTVL